MNVFMLQNDGLTTENFKKEISALSGIPAKLLTNDSQLIIQEHYFKNVYRNKLEKEFPEYDMFIRLLMRDSMSSEDLAKIDNALGNDISLFGYQVI